MIKFLWPLVGAFALLTPHGAAQELAPQKIVLQQTVPPSLLSPLFAENAVLQRDTRLPIWGHAVPHARVDIELGGQKADVVADETGYWCAKLGPFQAATRQTLRVTSGAQTETRANLAFGDVWLCSGQSNMEWQLLWGEPPVNNAQAEIEKANFPDLRLLKIPNAPALAPQHDFKANWHVCTPQTVTGLSAVGYFFGRELHQKTGVPIGLIDATCGGTNAVVWASGEALEKLPNHRDGVLAVKQTRSDIPFAEQIEAYYAQQDVGTSKHWANPSFDDKGWKTLALPGYWEKSGDAQLEKFDGLVWFRRPIQIPQNLRGQSAKLHLGAIDDADITFWNGEQIGQTNGYDKPREYDLSAQQLGGGAVLSVRVFDSGGDGGFNGPMQLVFQNGETLDLSGDWRAQISTPLGELGQPPVDIHAFPGAPGVLFNGMISPLLPTAIKGTIWYQGESNADSPEDYVPLLKTLIADWRARFSSGEFPFYQVQLAGFMDKTDDPNTPFLSWAWIRESQTRIAREIPNVALTTAVDIGDEKDVHPRNKQDVGARLARLALHRDYALDIEDSGPVLQGAHFAQDVATLEFKNARGLKIEGEAGRVFALAGQDKKWFWATPQIEGDKITLRAPEVPWPVAVRYAWQNFPRASVYNDQNLPMLPFRTDDWPR